MNKLQKSAWVNLGVITPMSLISMLCFVFLSRANAKGIDYIIIFLLVSCICAPLLYWYYKKKSIESGFDEREKVIYQRAFNISIYVMTVFLGLVCIIPFFVSGGGNLVKVVYLPMIFLSTGFVAQFANSMAIIIQCSLEEDNG